MSHETFTPPNPLAKARNGSGPVSIDPDILQRAEAAVENLQDDYASWAQQDIDGLKAAVAKARAEPSQADVAIADIYKRALDMKGQGGGFGYDLITAAGGLLTTFMEGRTTFSERDFQIVDAHIDAIQAVVRGDIKGDGGKIGMEIVAGLRELVLKQDR